MLSPGNDELGSGDPASRYESTFLEEFGGKPSYTAWGYRDRSLANRSLGVL